MASSKEKLTEDQLVEGLMGKILQNIVGGRINFVLDAFKDNPRLKKQTKKVAKAIDDLEKGIKAQGKHRTVRGSKNRVWR
jgi:predicted transcriptional regulator|tara:strand:+ start:111 stop:350 length:240 start_codon:yes stop_codon:yes gene_type:complete